MQQVKKEQAKRKIMMGGAYKDNDLIVCRNDGSFYNPNGFTCSWRKATRRFVKYIKENKSFMQKHGLSYPNYEYFTHHAMRSTLATFYKSCGMSDVVASKSLGHSSTQVTKDYYLSPIESELQRAAGILDNQIMKGLTI